MLPIELIVELMIVSPAYLTKLITSLSKQLKFRDIWLVLLGQSVKSNYRRKVKMTLAPGARKYYFHF